MDTAELIAKFERNHAQILKMNQDANAATEARLTEIEQRVVRRGGGGGSGIERSLGEAIVDAPELKAFVAGGCRGLARVEIKTVSTITSGATLGGPMIAPDVRTDPVVLPRRRMTIRDLLAPGQTSGNVVYFPQMTARQNNAAVVAEGAAKAKSDFTMFQVQVPVRTIAHYVDVSRQAFDDALALRSLIDGELRYGLSLAEETELLTGDGTGEHILGLVPQATAYSAAFAVTGETAIDRLALALLQAELALLPASGIVLNFTDWFKIRMTKDGMGRYIIGDPADAAPPQLWGVPLCITPAISAGTFLVGAFASAAQIFDRMGVEVLISSENANNFTTNLYTVRCEERLAMACKRPAAFITGSMP